MLCALFFNLTGLSGFQGPNDGASICLGIGVKIETLVIGSRTNLGLALDVFRVEWGNGWAPTNQSPENSLAINSSSMTGLAVMHVWGQPAALPPSFLDDCIEYRYSFSICSS